MNYLLSILLITLIYTTSYSQAQTDKYLITNVTVDTFDLTYDYVSQKAYLELSADNKEIDFWNSLRMDSMTQRLGH